MQEPVSAASDALIARLAERLTGITVREGFGATDAELQAGPVVSVHTMRVRRVGCAVESLGEDGEDPPVTMYRRGWPTITVQVDLWAAYPAIIKDRGNDVWEAIDGDALTADSSETSAYHDRPVLIAADDNGFLGATDGTDGESTARGEASMSWTVTLTTDLVQLATHPSQVETLLAIETELGEDLVEDTYDIADLPPEES